jgi:hypothetical protein
VRRPESPLRPKMRRSIRARGGRHVAIEGFGRTSPAYLTIGGASDVPVGAWLSPNELRRLIEAAKKILR